MDMKSYYNKAFGSKFIDPMSGMQSTIYPPVPFVAASNNSNISKDPKKLAGIYAKLKSGMGSVGNYIKTNPWQSAGLTATGLTNIAGLFDNDKIGGQAIGLAGGGAFGHFLLPKLLGKTVPPQLQVLATLSGGHLGALFDMLRQEKEDEAAAQMAYMQNINSY